MPKTGEINTNPKLPSWVVIWETWEAEYEELATVASRGDFFFLSACLSF